MFPVVPEKPESPDTQRVAVPFTEDVAELALLLPTWQVSALEAAAHSRGLTTAAMLRRLIEDFFGRTQRLLEPSARQWA
jgi:hypothetical protein